jgi:exopolysaccharide biosynthesis polyprenyl glycosylphosphotransferase
LIRQRHRSTAALYLLGDLTALVAAFATAWYLRFQSGIVAITDVPDTGPYLHMLPVMLVLWPLVFYFHGLYQARRGQSRVDEILTLTLAMLVASLMLAGFTAFYRPTGQPRPDGTFEHFTYSRTFLFFLFGSSLTLVGGLRVALRSFLRWRRLHNHNLQRILVLGAGALGREITEKIQAHREYGFEVVGFLDDDPGKADMTVADRPVLGRLHRLEEVLAAERVDQVYIALPVAAHKKTLRILQQIGKECVDVKLVPDILQYATLRASIEDLDGTPVINLSQVPLQGWSSLVKRGMDIALAGAALLVLLPFLPLLAAAIWIEDHGPIFYSQERMGLDGRSFMIWKFRSMRVGAESSTGPVWATREDPRRTRIGSFIRYWSIDELPQLWNVLKGDMSIIGPRPERPTFVHEFKHKIPQYMVRHRVKAGITGWAQVHGWRGNTSIKKRIQYDLYYIENWSLMLDLKILWMTLRHGIKPVNAH